MNVFQCLTDKANLKAWRRLILLAGLGAANILLLGLKISDSQIVDYIQVVLPDADRCGVSFFLFALRRYCRWQLRKGGKEGGNQG